MDSIAVCFTQITEKESCADLMFSVRIQEPRPLSNLFSFDIVNDIS